MGKCFVQPLTYPSDERYEHTPSYIKGIVSCVRQKKIKNTIVQNEYGRPDEEYYYHTLQEAETHKKLFDDDDSDLYERIEIIPD